MSGTVSPFCNCSIFVAVIRCFVLTGAFVDVFAVMLICVVGRRVCVDVVVGVSMVGLLRRRLISRLVLAWWLIRKSRTKRLLWRWPRASIFVGTRCVHCRVTAAIWRFISTEASWRRGGARKQSFPHVLAVFQLRNERRNSGVDHRTRNIALEVGVKIVPDYGKLV